MTDPFMGYVDLDRVSRIESLDRLSLDSIAVELGGFEVWSWNELLLFVYSLENTCIRLWTCIRLYVFRRFLEFSREVSWRKDTLILFSWHHYDDLMTTMRSQSNPIFVEITFFLFCFTLTETSEVWFFLSPLKRMKAINVYDILLKVRFIYFWLDTIMQRFFDKISNDDVHIFTWKNVFYNL